MPPSGKNSALKQAELARSEAAYAMANPYPPSPAPTRNATKTRKIFALSSRPEPFLTRPIIIVTNSTKDKKDVLVINRPKPFLPVSVTPERPRGGPSLEMAGKMPSKQSFVAAASKSVREAGRYVHELSAALMAWIQHVNQQKEELQRVQAMLDGIQAQKENRDQQVSEQVECVICRDREEQVAFQCGHRCCRQCAWDLTSCPICRL